MPINSQSGSLRAFDAALNRAAEATRVVEDYARFVLDDSHLTQLAKELRHDLVGIATKSISLDDRLAARDTLLDVGTEATTAAEFKRSDAWHVCSANLSRLQQSLRSLEEFAKALSEDQATPELAPKLEQLRYRSYTLAKALGSTRRGCVRLAEAKLYVLVSGQESLEAFQQRVTTLCEAGVDVLQFRDKRLTDRELLDRAQAMVAITRAAGTLAIMNDRPDLALLSGADGVHVGQDELGVKDVRSVVGTDQMIGVSTHSVEQARQAVLDGADYIGVGPTFTSKTKEFEDFPGLELVSGVSSEISLPTFAIGGIDLENLGQVLSAGASRIAVSAAVNKASDPAAAARALDEALKSEALKKA